ncbi:MAG: 3-phosphoshikimate 1-carboxyvinyltransferase [Candidatus Omnitrophota bacterium]
MILKVRPASSLRGTINLPASKSYSIRSFIIAALGGASKIFNVSDCEDVKVAIRACRKLGAHFSRLGRDSWEIKGIEGDFRFAPSINVGESGTTLRFLISLLTLTKNKIRVLGVGTLLKRPNHHLVKVLNQHGAKIKGSGKEFRLPLEFWPSQLCGGRMEINGSLSSQFISSLLITCPRLKEDSRIKIIGEQMVSQPYIEMTLAVLKEAGIKIEKAGEREFKVKGRQQFHGLKKFVVPDDYGLAAFFMVAGSILKGKITLRKSRRKDLPQADKAIIGFLKRTGAKIKLAPDKLVIEGPAQLSGGNFCLRNCPDLTPVMAVAALFAKGRTTLWGIAHARKKESDRISDLRAELLKIGADIRENRDALLITPVKELRRGLRLNPHKDHRLAMAFCVLGLKLGCVVEDIECIAKSYPTFLRDLRRLRPHNNI